MRFGRTLARFAAFLFVLAGLPAVGLADQPIEWGIGLQEAASPVMERMHDFYDLLYIVIMLIAVFVTLLLAYVMIRFRASRNPVPSKTSHNTPLEIAWTVIPVFILLIIAIPAFRLLYFQDRIQDADMTLKVVGHQWYWSYEYPDQGGFTFDSIMLADDELEPGQPRLLSVDEKVVLPVDTNIRILMTADDVLHAWAVPALGVKTDTVPGRVNESWVRITREGTYYGQCSELCGVNHGFMPIQVEAVSKEAFQEWIKQAQEKYARRDDAPRAVRVAANDNLDRRAGAGR